MEEIDKMHAAIEKSKGEVFPVFQYRYGLGIAQLNSLLASGLAGRPLVASVETHWNRPPEYYDIPWRGTWKGEAGGAILSHAIHAHDLLSLALGPVSKLHAFTDTLVNEIETEDSASISIRMESGALATSSVTLGSADDMSRFRFCFENVTVESGLAPYTPAEESWSFKARGTTKQEDINAVTGAVPSQLSGFAGFLKAIADALGGDTGRQVSFADGRRSIEFVTAVYISAKEGRPVDLPIDKEEPFYQGWSPE